jgi:hypothetical protein
LKKFHVLEHRKAKQGQRAIEDNVIQEAVRRAMLNYGGSKNVGDFMVRNVTHRKKTSGGNELSASNTLWPTHNALSKGARQASVVPDMGRKY